MSKQKFIRFEGRDLWKEFVQWINETKDLSSSSIKIRTRTEHVDRDPLEWIIKECFWWPEGCCGHGNDHQLCITDIYGEEVSYNRYGFDGCTVNDQLEQILYDKKIYRYGAFYDGDRILWIEVRY